VQQNQFDFSLFMVSAIRAQLPTPWQYNSENGKSQDRLDREFGIYPKIRTFHQPMDGTVPLNKSLPSLFRRGMQPDIFMIFFFDLLHFKNFGL